MRVRFKQMPQHKYEWGQKIWIIEIPHISQTLKGGGGGGGGAPHSTEQHSRNQSPSSGIAQIFTGETNHNIYGLLLKPLWRHIERDREEKVEWGREELLMMIMIDFQFECLIIHVNESKSSRDNQLWEIINMIIPQLKAYHTSLVSSDLQASRAGQKLIFHSDWSAFISDFRHGLVKLTETISNPESDIFLLELLQSHKTQAKPLTLSAGFFLLS